MKLLQNFINDVLIPEYLNVEYFTRLNIYYENSASSKTFLFYSPLCFVALFYTITGQATRSEFYRFTKQKRKGEIYQDRSIKTVHKDKVNREIQFSNINITIC